MNIIISLMFSIVLFSCAQKKANEVQEKKQIIPSTNAVTKEQNGDELKAIYQKLNSEYSDVYEQEYFDAFPNSFDSFVKIFGDLGKTNGTNSFTPAPLYEDSHLYIQAFFKLSKIDEETYFNRIIDICNQAKWDADGVNHFQHGLRIRVKKSLSVFIRVLSKRDDQIIKNFWRFYFDGPHLQEKLPNELKRVKELDERVNSLMETIFKLLQPEKASN